MKVKEGREEGKNRKKRDQILWKLTNLVRLKTPYIWDFITSITGRHKNSDTWRKGER
jgi:hypothetical protein